MIRSRRFIYSYRDFALRVQKLIARHWDSVGINNEGTLEYENSQEHLDQ